MLLVTYSSVDDDLSKSRGPLPKIWIEKLTIRVIYTVEAALKRKRYSWRMTVYFMNLPWWRSSFTPENTSSDNRFWYTTVKQEMETTEDYKGQRATNESKTKKRMDCKMKWDSTLPMIEYCIWFSWSKVRAFHQLVPNTKHKPKKILHFKYLVKFSWHEPR